jgi:hypothetical protein
MEVSGQLHALTALPGERAPGTHWIGGWVGPRVSLDTWRREEPYNAGNRTQAFQPVAIPTELSRLLAA